MVELSGQFPVSKLCELMNIKRNSFYAWKKKLSHPSLKKQTLLQHVSLFKQYHQKYPSHGYRWLNAKILLDTGEVMSMPYAHKCCKKAGIMCTSHHYRYKKEGEKNRIFPNLLMSEIQIDGPRECIVSDMTCFHYSGEYYELTLFMDLWNNEILTHALSSKRGDRRTYLSGLHDLIEFKKKYPNQKMILHTDQGSVYASKAFNELLPMYGIVHSMSRAGTPTDNGAMEAINGWVKEELFIDFHLEGNGSMKEKIASYIHFFNEKRPAYALNYLTPKQYRERYQVIERSESMSLEPEATATAEGGLPLMA